MKANLAEKQNLNTKRTISSLSNALIHLLKKKSFENITVQDLCTESLIARGTFYNYFEDKYDLLDYFWETLILRIDPLPSITSDFLLYNMNEYEEYLELFIDKYIEFFDLNRDSLNSVLIHNSLPSSHLIVSCRTYLNNYILSKIKNCSGSFKFSIPNELASQYYTNSILTILEWKYIYNNDATKEELIKYLRVLIKSPTLILEEIL